jgi:PAS domain S-box-containing protein
MIEVNQTTLDMLGYTRAEFIGQSAATFFDAKNEVKFAQWFAQLMRDGHIEDGEHEVLCKDGSRMHVIVGSKLVYDAQGQFVACRATLIDNSANKARQQQVQHLNSFLADVLESLPMGVMVLDKARNVVLKNKLLSRLLDYPPELIERDTVAYSELVQFDCDRGDHPDQTYATALASRLNLMATQDTVQLERRRHDGTYLAIVGQRIAEDWILLTFADVTETKLLTQSLEDSKLNAEVANAAKTRFLSTVSHELRSPLHTMLGHLSILRKAHAAALDPHLQVVENSGRQLLWLINDLLDFNNDAMRKDAMQFDWMDLDYLRVTLWNFGNIAAAAADNRFAIVIAADVPLQLMVDERRLIQVLQNLVGNACKYTQQGRVTLRIERSPHAANLGNQSAQAFRFSVQDTGRGISPHDLQYIFEPLYRSASASDQSGVGLGLAIARQWVRNMGGEIAVSSAIGHGSLLHFDLELQARNEGNGEGQGDLTAKNEGQVLHASALAAPPASDLPRIEEWIHMGRLPLVADWARELAGDARYAETAHKLIELSQDADLPALQRLLAQWLTALHAPREDAQIEGA